MLLFLVTSLLGSTAHADEAISSLQEEKPAASYLVQPQAGYPLLAEQTGLRADCRVRVKADPKGRPVRADLDESQPDGACPEPFRTQAIYAAWRGRLEPVQVGELLVPITFVQKVVFEPYEAPTDAVAEAPFAPAE
jgi:hypothetical protein